MNTNLSMFLYTSPAIKKKEINQYVCKFQRKQVYFVYEHYTMKYESPG